MVGVPEEYHWKYPASMENIDRICSEAAAVFDQYLLNTKDRFAIELLMREALNNAVIHGCQNDTSMSISCGVKITPGEVTIEVADGGKGFDWHSAPCNPSEPGCENGRGMSIYSFYASSIVFNDSGNCVILTRIIEGGIYARD